MRAYPEDVLIESLSDDDLLVIPELTDVVADYFGSMAVPEPKTVQCESYGGHTWLTKATYEVPYNLVGQLKNQVEQRTRWVRDHYENSSGRMQEHVSFEGNTATFRIPNISRYIERIANEV